MTVATHIGIVWNPSKTTREVLERAVEEAVRRAGAEPELAWFETDQDDPGRGAARAAIDAGAVVLVAAGGDGTVRAVAEELGESGADAELAIAPLGTGNLLARNLDVPIDDLAGAFERAITGEGRAIDLGWAELEVEGESLRHAFAVMAGFGIDAHMITETDDDLKERAGWLAYVESLGRAISASGTIGIELSENGGEASPLEAHTVIVGNCGVLQGGITLLPDADPFDGELDLLVLDAEGLGGWLDTMRNFMWDNGLKRLLSRGREDEAASSGSVKHRRVERLDLVLSKPRVFEADGDDLGETSRISITIQRAALRVR